MSAIIRVYGMLIYWLEQLDVNCSCGKLHFIYIALLDHGYNESLILRGVNMSEDCLLVSYDNSSDTSVLTVSRDENGRIRVLNTMQGDSAFGIYCLLTGYAIMKNKEVFNDIMFQLKCIKEHLKFVSKTTDDSVGFDIEVLNTCISQLETQII